MIDEYGASGGVRIGRGTQKYLGETYCNASFSTTNPT
jgi:hypothetical protein